MKKLKKYLWSILFLAAILFPFSHVKAATNPYRQSGPYGTNCTWYACKMAYEKAGITLPGWGNAKDWYNDARNSGYTVGTTPKVGAVAVWPYDGGGYGHVAYVSAVQSSTNIQVMEANYAGNSSIGNYRGWFNPASSGTVYYIYQ